jgi:hypothetical protein
MVVFAVTDKRNSAPPNGLVPLIVFFAILGIAVAFGMQTGMLSFRLIRSTVTIRRQGLQLIPRVIWDPAL